MKISSIILAMIFIVSIANAQMEFEAPDYNQIEKITQDSASDFYYPKLFKRYENLDITLTSEEMRALYYGYLFQESYSPVQRPQSPNVLIQIPNKTDELNKKIIEKEKDVLENHPFNLTSFFIISECYSDLGKNDILKNGKLLQIKQHKL